MACAEQTNADELADSLLRRIDEWSEPSQGPIAKPSKHHCRLMEIVQREASRAPNRLLDPLLVPLA
jgi:hypothetical protein